MFGGIVCQNALIAEVSAQQFHECAAAKEKPGRPLGTSWCHPARGVPECLCPSWQQSLWRQACFKDGVAATTAWLTVGKTCQKSRPKPSN